MERQYTYAVEIVAPDVGHGQLQNWLQQAGLKGWELVAVVVHGTSDLWYHFKLELGQGRGGRPFDRFD